MLSIPGKEDIVSVYSMMRERYPDADGPLIVHRLDMATSGLLVVAKNKQVHQNLQAQFKNRSVGKRYIALLQGSVSQDAGTVELPLWTESRTPVSARRNAGVYTSGDRKENKHHSKSRLLTYEVTDYNR